jgi:NAD(P)H-flavin reductase
MAIKEYQTTILSNDKFKDDNFIVSLEPKEKLEFKAGQFVMIHNADDSEKRAFSIASPPSKDNIDIILKHNKEGKVSPFVFNLKEGDKLKISGPFGRFTLNETNNEIVFISAGTGIAPFRSMIIDAYEKDPNKKITLIYGFRYDLFWDSDFRDLEKKYKNFKLVCSCTKPDENWKGLKGRVTEHLKEVLPSPENKVVYICGPNAMINATKKILIEDLKFQEGQIHIEKWG